jgi:hypothetical protein
MNQNQAMWGGVLWCTGNILCGPTIQLIGLASGLLIWGNTCMLSGWASGKFGLFGLTPVRYSLFIIYLLFIVIYYLLFCYLFTYLFCIYFICISSFFIFFFVFLGEYQ